MKGDSRQCQMILRALFVVNICAGWFAGGLWQISNVIYFVSMNWNLEFGFKIPFSSQVFRQLHQPSVSSRLI